MTERRRVQREMTIAVLRMKVNEGSAAIKAAVDDPENVPAGTADQVNREFGMLLHRMVSGLDPLGVQSDRQFYDRRPEGRSRNSDRVMTELLEEMFLAGLQESGLMAVEEKNSQSPGTFWSRPVRLASPRRPTRVKLFEYPDCNGASGTAVELLSCG